MKGFINFLITGVLFLTFGSLLFSSVPNMLAGSVLGLQPGTVSYIIKSCVMGKCGFEIWELNNYQLFLGPLGEGYGQFVTDVTNSQIVAQNILSTGGNYTSAETMTTLTTALKDGGWQKVPTREATFGVRGCIAAAGALIAKMRLRRRLYVRG